MCVLAVEVGGGMIAPKGRCSTASPVRGVGCIGAFRRLYNVLLLIGGGIIIAPFGCCYIVLLL